MSEPIPPAEFADLDLVGYLYNSCYGGFSFSDTFVARLNEMRAAEGLEPVTDYAYSSEYSGGRYDPMVIKLFLEMGSGATSGPYAKLKLKWFPREFIEAVYVREYDGMENAAIPFQELKARFLEDFMRERTTNPSLTLDDLETRYKNLLHKQVRYGKFEEVWREPSSAEVKHRPIGGANDGS
jgi:hypothetical protein